MIFVETSGWFASSVPSDRDHEAAKKWLLVNQERLITTDYVIDETLTLFRSRGEHVRSLSIADRFFSNNVLTADIGQTFELFKKFSDKDWSFTDCSSKFVCEKFGIGHALSFDNHFRQFGSLTVVP